jgi:hypothetical protein
MALLFTKKIILPTPTEFVRWISRAMLLNQKGQRDTSLTMAPRVTRAKSLVEKTGVLIADEQKDDGNG